MKSIYSRKAILGFSTFFTPLLGGILLRKNLNQIGKRKEGNLALLTSALFTIVAISLIVMFKIEGIAILTLVSGWLLTELFYNNNFDNSVEFNFLPIKRPLLISLLFLAVISISLLVIYYQY